MKKKIIIVLPDGLAIRNFVYTDFIKTLQGNEYQVLLAGSQDIIGCVENEFSGATIVLPEFNKTYWLADVVKRSYQLALLTLHERIYKNSVFRSYNIRDKRSDTKSILKKIIIYVLLKYANNYKRCNKLKLYYQRNSGTSEYKEALDTLIKDNLPDLIFLGSQRSTEAVVFAERARELNIPTVSFIYSWDNPPKAMLLVNSSYYFCWSNHMKNELLNYHAEEIRESQLFVTGTPQFVNYTAKQREIISREDFAEIYSLNINEDWICFSGDDETTSPFDYIYLMDVAKSVRRINCYSKTRIHIIFRRCPVDWSKRYDSVLEEFRDCITSVDPDWKKISKVESWNKFVPNYRDSILIASIAQHCLGVINIGSTMAFDFSIFFKPCIYIKYNVNKYSKWNIEEVYRFIHFQSMPNQDCVIWLNSSLEWDEKIKIVVNQSKDAKGVTEQAIIWHQKIAMFPLGQTSLRMLTAFNRILGC